MPSVRIWDLPVRLFHWFLVVAFLCALSIASLADDEGAIFPLHALIGLVMVFAVLLRVLWGFAGSRWARFRSFLLRPAELLRYLAAVGRRAERPVYPAHNPASAWFVVLLLAGLLTLGVTGVAAARGYEGAEDVHEVMAWLVLAMAGVHVAGIALHTAVVRENIAAGMVTGRKHAPAEAAIPSNRPWSAAVFVILIAGWTFSLARAYDPQRGVLDVPLAGMSLQLAEDGGEHEDDD